MNPRVVTAEEILKIIDDMHITSDFQAIQLGSDHIIGIIYDGMPGYFIGMDKAGENLMFHHGSIFAMREYSHMNHQYALSTAKILNRYIDMDRWVSERESYI